MASPNRYRHKEDGSEAPTAVNRAFARCRQHS